MASVRLHKWLAQQGVASRRQAERWITYGRVEVNGVVDRTLGRQIDPETDKVRVDGKLVSDRQVVHVYWLLNKPEETITARTDPGGRMTIFDLPSLKNLPFRLVPVGRLDYRTEGLLLLSNDGEWVHQLMHPRFHVERVYEVLLPRPLDDKQIARLNQGIRLDDGMVEPLSVRAHGTRNMGGSRGYRYRLSVHEGRNRLVRRVFEKLGVRIIRLIRVAFGPVSLPPGLAAGEVVPLTAGQIQYLKRELASRDPSVPEHKSSPRKPRSRAKANPIGSPRNRVSKKAEAAAP